MFEKFLLASRDHSAFINGQAFMNATKHNSSSAEVFCRKGFLKNFTKYPKHL